MIKLILPTLLFVFFIMSCNKENQKDKITITGKLVKDCAGTPYSNQTFAWINPGKGFFEDREVVDFRTDLEGKFEVKVDAGPHAVPSQIRKGDDGGRPVMELDPESDLCLGTFNTSPTANYQLKIKVNNSYAVGDTILLTKKGNEIYKIPCPISDSNFSIIYDYQNSLQTPTLNTKNKVSVGVYYHVYSGQKNTSSFISKKYETFDYLFEGCSSTVNEIRITVE